MKRMAIILISLIMSLSLSAQSGEVRKGSSGDPLESRVFEIQYRSPQAIAMSIRLLGSGTPRAEVAINPELRTLTVRDYPENLARIEEAIKRLDVPSSATRGIRIQLYVLVGQSGPEEEESFPPELANVVAELKTALRYSSYSLMTSAIHQTKAGHGIEGSGVADASLVSFETPGAAPLIYTYSLREIELQTGDERAAVDVRSFRFMMKMPVPTGDELQYIDVGFDTPVMVREGEKVVVGTTAMGDKALVVVVTADVQDQE